MLNAASDITYRPLIEANDTGRCTEYMNFNLLKFKFKFKSFIG